MSPGTEYRAIIKSFIEALRPKTYLEVGCRSGSTIRTILKAANSVGSKIYAIDIDDVKSKLPKSVKFIQGKSADIGVKWDKSLDMVFIDADHNATSVMQDFRLFSRWVKHNGIIFLHDTFPSSEKITSPTECGDAWKVAWRLRKDFGSMFEIMTVPVTNGLSIIRKSCMQVDWQADSDASFKEK